MAAPDLDQLVEQAAVAGQIAAGAKRAVVAAHTPNRRLALTLPRESRQRGNNASAWSEADDAFVREHWGRLPIHEIARAMGRTYSSVKIRQTRVLRLVAPTKAPDILTANMVAYGLGRDVHAIVKLIERGIIPGRVWPYRHGRRAFIVDRLALAKFALNPQSWIYFDPAQVGRSSTLRRDRQAQKYAGAWFEKLREQVLRRQAAWGDEWWTPGQVAAYHHVNHRSVNKAINTGRLPAVKYQNWRVRRSDAMAIDQLVAWHGKGGPGQSRFHHGPRSNAFLVLATAVGFPPPAIEALMKVKAHTVDYRQRMLRRRGRLPWIIRDHQLPVQMNRAGAMLADWKALKGRFPKLAETMQAFRRGAALSHADLLVVRGVLRAWATFFGRTKAQRAIATSLYTVGKRDAHHFLAVYRRMRAAGIDPYRTLKEGGS